MHLSYALALTTVIPTASISTLTPTDLIFPVVTIVLLSLGWSRAVVGIVAFVGVGRMTAIVLSRLVPALGFGSVWRFVAGNGGFVHGVYVASILRAELWPGRRGYVEGAGREG